MNELITVEIHDSNGIPRFTLEVSMMEGEVDDDMFRSTMLDYGQKLLRNYELPYEEATIYCIPRGLAQVSHYQYYYGSLERV